MLRRRLMGNQMQINGLDEQECTAPEARNHETTQVRRWIHGSIMLQGNVQPGWTGNTGNSNPRYRLEGVWQAFLDEMRADIVQDLAR